MTGAGKDRLGGEAPGAADSGDLVLDLAHLDRQCLHDRDFAAELLIEFRAQSLSLAERIVGADGEARVDLAHRLRGSALAVGANRVASAAEAVERGGGRTAPPAGTAEMSQALVRLAEAVAEAAAEIDRQRL